MDYFENATETIKRIVSELERAASNGQVNIHINELSQFAIANALVALAEQDDPLLIILQLPSGEFVNLAGFINATPYSDSAIDATEDEKTCIRIAWRSGAAEHYYGKDARAITDWLATKRSR